MPHPPTSEDAVPLHHVDPEGLHPVPGVLGHAVVVPEARLLGVAALHAPEVPVEIDVVALLP